MNATERLAPIDRVLSTLSLVVHDKPEGYHEEDREELGYRAAHRGVGNANLSLGPHWGNRRRAD